MANEKRLIDTNACPCIKCDRLGKCRPGFCEAFAEWWLSPVDTVEVVHGRWILADDGDGDVCSVCGTDFCNIIYETENWNYCPNCGAKMET